MTKLFQNKMIVGGLCILLAAVLSFVVLPGINHNKSETVKIIKLKNDISAGAVINDDMVEEKEVGSYGLPASIVTDRNDVIGKYAVTDIKKDDLILKDKISEYAANARLDDILQSGKKLVTVSLPSIASSVGNYIIAGDIISIVCYKGGDVYTPDELRNLEVYSVQNDDAGNIEDDTAEDEKLHRRLRWL